MIILKYQERRHFFVEGSTGTYKYLTTTDTQLLVLIFVIQII